MGDRLGCGVGCGVGSGELSGLGSAEVSGLGEGLGDGLGGGLGDELGGRSGGGDGLGRRGGGGGGGSGGDVVAGAGGGGGGGGGDGFGGGESGVAQVEKNAGADKVDIWILRTALVSDVIGAIGYIFVRTSALFVASAVVTGFGGLGSATLQASLSKHVPAERVGQLLGAIGLMHALSRIFFPLIFNGLYYATVKSYPQAFFVLLASIYGVCVLSSLRNLRHLCESIVCS